MNSKMYDKFVAELSKQLPSNVIFTDELTTLAYGTDASCYRLIPKVVIKAQNELQIKIILDLASKLELPLTFRAQGTSLSGQAITDSILVIVKDSWNKYKIDAKENTIMLEAGIIASQANNYLKPFGKKIGPDPATINVALIGGIVANNSSGMCCGVAQNSYNTIKDMRIILHDGTILDTGDILSVKSFRKTHSNLLQELENLAKEVQSDEELRSLISRKYKIKNTTGYSINALVDFKDGIEILKHLIVGSEGTLAFISNVTFYTVDDFPYKASALVLFKNLEDACASVTELEHLGKIIDSAEFMDRKSLKTMEEDSFVPQIIKTLNENACSILIQTTALSKKELQENINKIQAKLSFYDLIEEAKFKDKEEEYNQYWNIRKGLFTKVGALRRKNTTVIIEDITFPIIDLAKGTRELRELLDKYNFEDAIIFGHSLAGNLHFVLCIDFANSSEIKNYDAFMQALVSLVAVKFQGSLKAEHGTGRNIAPFVEKEWGAKAYSLMLRIKAIFDPNNILNRDVIITKDPNLHLKNLKEIKESNDLIDKCIECGFCEPTCPSNEITFSPRHRIVAHRYLKEKASKGLWQEVKLQMNTYQYKALDTCAGCSLCSIVCPVGINTGTLTKELRYEYSNNFTRNISKIVANNYNIFLFMIRSGLLVGKILSRIVGNKILNKTSIFINKLVFRKIPIWRTSIPRIASLKKLKLVKEARYNLLKSNDALEIDSITGEPKVFVYFVSCMNKIFGINENHPLSENKSIYEVMQNLALKSGYKMIVVNDNSLCCGMPFYSKGQVQVGRVKTKELEKKLLKASEQGKYPIVSDLSSCTLQMLSNFETKELQIYDIAKFSLKHFVPQMKINAIKETITVHVNCSAQKINEKNNILQLARLCASDIVIPSRVSCCGFAGDKGMFLEELNQSALRTLKEEVKGCSMGFSTNCTCEIGLSEISEKPYTSILYLLDKASEIKIAKEIR